MFRRWERRPAATVPVAPSECVPRRRGAGKGAAPVPEGTGAAWAERSGQRRLRRVRAVVRTVPAAMARAAAMPAYQTRASVPVFGSGGGPGVGLGLGAGFGTVRSWVEQAVSAEP